MSSVTAARTPLSPSPGLTTPEAAERLRQHGPNELQHDEGRSPWLLLLAQFNSPLIWLLVVACVISAVLGEIVEAVAIGAIVVLNALVGFGQEYRAQRALLALRSMTAPRARVLRDGQSAMIASAEVVPGDVLVLEAGDVVAADARLLEAHALTTNEAPLTGESMPVEKSARPVQPEAALAERTDSVFLGTSVSTGTARAEVTHTGMRTELGKIAHLVATAIEGDTPLQKRLAVVSRTLLYLCLGVSALMGVLELVRGEGWMELMLSAIALAVAAVPEGLPAIVTIALALGVRRMAALNVLVRKLPSVETLGCATVVCTDKTGTLTVGQMEVRETWGPDAQALLFAVAACCDAELDGKGGGTGDPTEVALLRASAARGIDREEIERTRPRVRVRPFDSSTKSMAIARADGVLYLKGAGEVVAPRCTSGTEGAHEAAHAMAARGLRVLAVATGRGESEENLHLVGLVGLADPPRPEAIAAVAAARRAGIRTVMVTGDHPATALVIAQEMGIVQPGDDPAERVHARVTAEEKLHIVRRWKERGEVVAMTGDGVNDAPALREADIGIAMGKGGTEVTRQASDMVLADDNYASIVAAIREGRGIFDGIRKALVYLLTGNTGLLLLMLGSAMVGLPLPLLPLHLLWINLLTDGLPGLALVMDPPSPDVLDRPPRRPDEPMLGRPEWTFIGAVGVLEASIALGAFAWANPGADPERARAVAFTMVVLLKLWRSFAARSGTRLFWELGAFSNPLLIAVVLISAVVQVSLPWIPQAQAILHLGEPAWRDLAVVLGLSFIPVTVLELRKVVLRLRARRLAPIPSGSRWP